MQTLPGLPIPPRPPVAPLDRQALAQMVELSAAPGQRGTLGTDAYAGTGACLVPAAWLAELLRRVG
jgi:hypothetical protein